MLHLMMVSLTSLLPSSGLARGVIDRPVQRDQATGLPTIYGSSIKGAIKSYLLRFFSKEQVENVLGGDYPDGKTIPSKVSIGDAFLMALPAPSYNRFVVWLVPKFNLLRMTMEIKNLGSSIDDHEENSVKYYEISDSNSEYISLLDFVVKVRELSDKRLKKSLNLVVKALQKTFDEDLFKEYPVLLLGNKEARQLIERALGKRARIKIDPETGTVERGKLWYEEYYPPYTVFFVPVHPTKCAFRDAHDRNVCELFQRVSGKTIPFGGSLTVGMGFTKVHLLGDLIGSLRY